MIVISFAIKLANFAGKIARVSDSYFKPISNCLVELNTKIHGELNFPYRDCKERIKVAYFIGLMHSSSFSANFHYRNIKHIFTSGKSLINCKLQGKKINKIKKINFVF